jgi:AcrR family transcriptional regulator
MTDTPTQDAAHPRADGDAPVDLTRCVAVTAATKALVFETAERLFALHGIQNVSVRDITGAAKVNLASVNYHFGSKDALLFEIYRQRATELKAERQRMLELAIERHDGTPPVREILKALFATPITWSAPDSERRISLQFLLRARAEGTAQMCASLQNDTGHLEAFARALIAACPHIAPKEVYWRLHFCLGMVHNNGIAEIERLRLMSDGHVADEDMKHMLRRMLSFAEAGFLADDPMDR